MRFQFYIYLSIILLACGLPETKGLKKGEQILAYPTDSVDVKLEILKENLNQNFYDLSWKDPYILKDSNSSDELHCYIRDSKGLVGYYRGLSTSMRHAGFQTKDSMVWVIFMKRPRTSMRSKIQNKIFDCDFSEFNPIPLLLKREKVQNFRLKSNSNIVKLFYSSSDARSEDPTIIYGVDCHMPWALHRYYLYPFSGQILIGSKWLKKIGTYECAKSNMRIVDPLVAYQDKSGEVHLGKEIINAGELDLAQFNIEQFDVHLNAIPY